MLKKIDQNDIEILRSWRNSDDVSKFMISKTKISKDDQLNWYKQISNDSSGYYWVIMLKNKIKIGYASLTKINNLNYTAEPGLYIGDKNYRNTFYGIEAFYYLLDFAFNHIQLKEIKGMVMISNQPALKMNKQFGFKILNTYDNFHEISLKKEDFLDNKFINVFKKSIQNGIN
jgi:UDP-4-amino-4,6-dideoxy-N-acetyl-beta-L-altrosamine N-acetyltransferase